TRRQRSSGAPGLLLAAVVQYHDAVGSSWKGILVATEEQNPAGASSSTDSRSLALVRDVVAAGRPLTYIRSAEEQRIGDLLREAAQTLFSPPIPVWTWSLTEGMRRDDGTLAEALEPRAALDFIAEHTGAAIFHLKDFHEPMHAPEIRRRLRDLYAQCFDAGKFVVISSPVRFLPDDLAHE